jgi:hypothetical protein
MFCFLAADWLLCNIRERDRINSYLFFLFLNRFLHHISLDLLPFFTRCLSIHITNDMENWSARNFYFFKLHQFIFFTSQHLMRA